MGTGGQLMRITWKFGLGLYQYVERYAKQPIVQVVLFVLLE